MYTVKINNTEYYLDLERALANGIATKVPKTRKIRVSDVPNGRPFKWYDSTDNKYRNYVMLDNKKKGRGQVICIDHDNPVTEYGGATWFLDPTYGIEFLDTETQEWVSEIKEE